MLLLLLLLLGVVVVKVRGHVCRVNVLVRARDAIADTLGDGRKVCQTVGAARDRRRG